MIPEPPPSSIRDNSGQATTALRHRAAVLGVPTWRCDNAGLILADPGETGPVGLLWSCSSFIQLVSRTAAKWAGEDKPELVEVFPGAWAIPLPEQRRRDRSGCILALAFSDRALSGEFFESACVGAALDAPALRRMLLPRARYSLGAAHSLRDSLLWMAKDLAHVEECDATAAGFTSQLTDCFETIDLLYDLGRSMSDLAQPVKFVENLCKRLRTTLSFTWVAGWFGTRGDPGCDLSGHAILSGSTPLAGALEQALPNILSSLKPDGRAMLLNEFNGEPIPGSAQILVQPVMRGGRPMGLMLAGEKFGRDPQISSYDFQLIEAAAGYIGAFLENAGLYSQQKALSLGVLESLTAAIDAKDRYTCGHSQRVAHMSHLLALSSGMPLAQAERIRIAGLVHDVGKIGVPEAVLCKSGKLTDAEFDAIKMHPEIGYKILKDLPLLEDILPGVLSHHERWDGRGYPHKLKSDAIPPIARIIALADTFDAMSSTRSYRAAQPRAAVLAEIRKCAGVQFDPVLAGMFVTLDFAEYDRMVAQHAVRAETLRLAA